ncbi:MAG: hypothetical protein KF799_06560 [Bdellovibrionales bacterium]|nr:hypothetical protein [Bdellovibrionales bacterium]
MNKLTFMAVASLSIVLAGCQKAKMTSAPASSPAQYTPGPVGPGGPSLPPPMPPRYPEHEPIDVPPPPPPQPPVVIPPPPPPVVIPPRPTDREPIDPIRPSPPIPQNPPPTVYPPQPPTMTPIDRQTPVVPPPPPVRPPVVNPPVVNPPVVNPPPVQPPPVVNPRPTVINPPPLPTTPMATQIPEPPRRPLINNPPVPVPKPVRETELPSNPPLPVPKPAELLKPTPITPTPVSTPIAKPVPVQPPPPVYDPIDGQCEVEPVTIPPKQEKTKLDILFVVDTSGSIRKGPNNNRSEGGELAKMAEQMDSFVNNLKSGTDTNIGVMLAHGPKSPYFGKLFSAGEVAVIKSESYKKDRAGMWKLLRNKMTKVPDDKWNPHQGEAPLMGIFAAIASNQRRNAIIEAGLFRKDANLAIIIVTDENDVCWQYPKPLSDFVADDQAAFLAGNAPVLKKYVVSKAKSTISPDRLEMQAQKLCSIKGTDGKERVIDYKVVAEKIRALTTPDAKGQALIEGKVMVNGIVYLKNDGLKSLPGNEDENEMAHGVLELIHEVGGKAADMAEVRQGGESNFASALDLLGKTTSFQAKHNVNFVCRSGLNDGKGFHAKAIDMETVDLQIIESNRSELDSFNKERPNLSDFGTKIATYSTRCSDKGACNTANGGLRVESIAGNTIRVTPANATEYEKVMKERGIDTAKYKITFKTKRGVNPHTGVAAEQEGKVKSEAPGPKVPVETKASKANTSSAKAATSAKTPVKTSAKTAAPSPKATSTKAPSTAPKATSNKPLDIKSSAATTGSKTSTVTKTADVSAVAKKVTTSPAAKPTAKKITQGPLPKL